MRVLGIDLQGATQIVESMQAVTMLAEDGAQVLSATEFLGSAARIQILPSGQYYPVPSDYALEYLQPLCYLSDVVYCRIGLGLAEEDAKSRAR